MSLLLNNPAQWHLRAQEARLLALHLRDPEANATVLKIADEYDHLAVRAAERVNKAVPPSPSEPMNKSEAPNSQTPLVTQSGH